MNLLGEHTDYNDGYVLPCALDRRTMVACGPSTDGRYHFVSSDLDRTDNFDPAVPIERTSSWADFARGVAAELLELGRELTPLNLVVASNLPLGAALSSSAALELALIQAMTSGELFGTDAAIIGQRAENRFVGFACGIMDQMVSACGMAGHALLVDCRTLETLPIPLPENSVVMVIDSGIRHSNADGGYNDRREECRHAAAHYAVPALCDLSVSALDARKGGLDDVAYRRVRHIVTENDRVLAAAEALGRNDLSALGTLMRQSHVSMRGNFAITTPEIDWIMEVANGAIGTAGGARMTGGGSVAPSSRLPCLSEWMP